jgi:Ca-activated chloride channel family protein
MAPPALRRLQQLIVAAAASGILAIAVPFAAVQQPTFRSGTGTIVSLFATVTDAENRLVPDLAEGEFEVLDNDKPQPLVVFKNEIEPITVVVMLDTSGSMTGTISLLKTAAQEFLIRLLPADKGIVGAFNDKIEIGSHFTNDRDALIADVKELDYGNGTRLYDALAESLNVLKGVEGRRVILIFTDGDDTSSRVGRGTIIDRTRAEEVMVYAIGLESDYFDGARMVKSKPDSGLRKLADETGGGYFELKKTSQLGPTFSRVAQELHGQYVLGFEAKQLDGKVHKLALKMKQPGMNGRARKSYVASPPQPPSSK